MEQIEMFCKCFLKKSFFWKREIFDTSSTCLLLCALAGPFVCKEVLRGPSLDLPVPLARKRLWMTQRRLIQKYSVECRTCINLGAGASEKFYILHRMFLTHILRFTLCPKTGQFLRWLLPLHVPEQGDSTSDPRNTPRGVHQVKSLLCAC